MTETNGSSERKNESATPRVLVVLCTYNEAQNLPKLFQHLDQVLPAADVLVVDDNSPDGTGRIVEAQQAGNKRYHLLAREGKLGLGSALRDGMRWCLERDYEYLINLDADLSHDPATAPAMLQACMRPDVDVAVGSRYIPGGGFPGLPWYRKLISWALNSYANRLLRLPISDCSGSYRCYCTQALKQIDLNKLRCNGYGYLEEILVALHRSGARLAEVPIQFECRLAGRSKLGVGDIVGVFQVVHTLAWRRT